MRLQVNTDGGFHQLSGRSAISCIIRDMDLNEVIYTEGIKTYVSSNNEAEYLAFSSSIDVLIRLRRSGLLSKLTELLFVTDSQLMASHFNSTWEITAPELVKQMEAIKIKLSLLFPEVNITMQHVKRIHNNSADVVCDLVLEAI